MNTRLFSRTVVALIALCLIAWSCAKLQDTLPIAPTVGVHPAGWADTNSPKFHGQSIRNAGYSRAVLDSCATCHGNDGSGGLSGVSCSKSGCHVAADNGPAACYTCHGDPKAKTYFPPRALNGSTDSSYVGVGQHRGHLIDTSLSTHVFGKCITCHVVPDSIRSPGHINGTVEVTIGDPIAFKQTNVKGGYKYTDTLPTVVPTPHWDKATQTCANVYCHGAFKNGNANYSPKWTDVEQDACGTCHGDPVTHNPLPGGTHPKKTDCNACHEIVVDANNNFIDRSLHINGKLEVLGLVKDVW